MEETPKEQTKKDEVIKQPEMKRIKTRKLGWLFVLLGMVLVGFALGITAKVILSVNSTNTQTGEKVVFFDQLKRLISSPDKQLDGESADRINILLIGIGGEGHDGAYLADTIIMVSIKPSTREVAMLSIPRDLYVDIPGYGARKINNAMAFGHSDQYPGGGETLLSRVVSDVTGQPINYFARIDFTGFKKVIDDLGGIWVNVDTSFADYSYPTEQYGYQTVRFQKGLQKMDGATALKYVRSRHGTNGEGSDFARSKRQQKVLLAVKDQGLSLATLTTPKSIITALDDIGQHNRTNLQLWEILRLAKMAGSLQTDSMITKVLDDSPDNLLKSATTQDGAYILLPKSGNFDAVKLLAKNIFMENLIAKERPRIELQNGSQVAGLAAQISQELGAESFDVINVKNAARRDFTQTVIYDFTGGTKPNSLDRLKNFFNTQIVGNAVPVKIQNGTLNANALKNVANSAVSPDFLVVLGADQASRLTKNI